MKNSLPNLSEYEKLLSSTVRIDIKNEEGEIGFGTGFHYSFLNDGENLVPAIVTNKHVIKGARHGGFTISTIDSGGKVDRENPFRIDFENFESFWIGHPDPDVDLAVMPSAPIFSAMENEGKTPLFVTLGDSLIPSELDVADLNGSESITMVGYPTGLWDDYNNLPILRKGVLATPYSKNWKGKSEFLIDAACFPGSSGSPVLLFEPGSHFTKDAMVMGPRFKFLGILYAGPMFTATGTIEVIEIPVAHKPIPVTHIPMNLGVVVRSDRLRAFEAIFQCIQAKR